ncbi:PilN family type IVB pilus formation outer membrane protein [Aeromonas caviae]|uniref:PilN family type IVB pilus formation outer membrane protein n=1 Tax=Aeromonas caviae TaxID=648 RepID=UPI0030143C3D
MKLKTVAWSVAMAMILQGCAAHRVYKSLDEGERVGAEATSMMDGMINTSQERPSFRVQSGTPWVQTKAIKTAETRVAEQYPELNCEIVFATQTPVSLIEFAQRTSSLCGIPVRVTPDAVTQSQGGGGIVTGGATTGAGAIPSLPGIPDLPVPVPTGNPLAAGNSMQQQSVSYQNGSKSIMTRYRGPFAGLLDTVTANLGLAWRANNNGVEIYYLDTQVYTLAALQATTETSSVIQAASTSSMGGSNSSTSGSNGSNQSTTTMIKNDLLSDVEKNLKTMLTPVVGRMSLSPSTGAVTVTDTPQVQRNIKRYIERENAVMTQQVAFRVEVYSVSFRDDDSLSLDMDLVYDRLAKQGFTLKNISGLTPDNAVQGGISISDGRWKGSKVLFNALAEQGNVKVVTKSTVTTTNLQPAPVQVSRQIGYLQSSEINSGSDTSGTTTSLQPGTITTGFSMTLLPYILPDSEGDILLQYAVNLSNLLRINTVSSGNSSIQTPEIDSRIFSQRVKVRSGEMLVVGGFEQDTDDATAQGTGSAFNPLLGGGFASKKSRSVIVVAITPSMG